MDEEKDYNNGIKREVLDSSEEEEMLAEAGLDKEEWSDEDYKPGRDTFDEIINTRGGRARAKGRHRGPGRPRGRRGGGRGRGGRPKGSASSAYKVNTRFLMPSKKQAREEPYDPWSLDVDIDEWMDLEEDNKKEQKARRAGLEDLQCPDSSYKSPLVQFIKRHWVNSCSTNAVKKRERRDMFLSRREQKMQVLKKLKENYWASVAPRPEPQRPAAANKRVWEDDGFDIGDDCDELVRAISF